MIKSWFIGQALGMLVSGLLGFIGHPPCFGMALGIGVYTLMGLGDLCYHKLPPDQMLRRYQILWLVRLAMMGGASPLLAARPPSEVLAIGCGFAFSWGHHMWHRYRATQEASYKGHITFKDQAC